jgi:chlorophyll/bacteriochlorophyll a synthase
MMQHSFHYRPTRMICLVAFCVTTATGFQGAYVPKVATKRSTLFMLPNDPLGDSRSSPSSQSFDLLELSSKNSIITASPTRLQLARNQEADDGSSSVRQLLGVKGASETTEKWKIRLQLTKPVTWVPLVWGVMCGAAASGNYHWIWNPFDETDRDVLLGLTDASKGFVAMILAGPFLTGYTQTINDWYDREIDAINEPYRPIPSGAISEGEVIAQIWVLLLGGLGIAYGLDVWAGHDVPTVLLLSIFGSFISYIYSAPPLKLKQNGWAGNYALGASYISLPWWCGQAVFGTLDRPVYFILYVARFGPLVHDSLVVHDALASR